MTSDEIVSGEESGGTNTSHTIAVPALEQLLATVAKDATGNEYARAVLDDNVLGKETSGARRRALRYLRELYLLRPESTLFRALRDLWAVDRAGRPLLAGLCALARDSVFRASSSAIMESKLGDELVSTDFAAAVEKIFPSSYSSSTLAKIGRNSFSSWEQTGHLSRGKRHGKTRSRATCGPATVTYALLLGHLQGVRGQALFETLWACALDQTYSHLVDLAASASQQGMLEFRHGGGVIEVTFHELLRPFDGKQGVLL